jgi:uncharacterized protein
MATTVDKIKEIETEMARTQKNKATSFHLGQLKAKLAKLKKELLTPSSSGGGGGSGFDVARTGVASVGFIGFPSVGKSTLMSRLTGQHSEAAAYEFTTLTTVPGQVMYNGAAIQMLDLPGIIQGAKDGKGRGRQVIAVAKTCHLIFIVLDVNKPLTDKRVIENELEGFGIRINKSPPNIVFKKKDKGGLNITSTVPLSHIDHDEIKAVMNEYRISSADIAIRCDATVDDLIDVLEAKSRSYIPVIYALNKIDAISIEELDLLYRIPNACPISSEHGWNVDELLEQMWEKLQLKRVYTKPKGRQPDYSAPVVLRQNASTVEDFVSPACLTVEIHANFSSAMRSTNRLSSNSGSQSSMVGPSSTSLSESGCSTSSRTRISVSTPHEGLITLLTRTQSPSSRSDESHGRLVLFQAEDV